MRYRIGTGARARLKLAGASNSGGPGRAALVHVWVGLDGDEQEWVGRDTIRWPAGRRRCKASWAAQSP